MKRESDEARRRSVRAVGRTHSKAVQRRAALDRRGDPMRKVALRGDLDLIDNAAYTREQFAKLAAVQKPQHGRLTVYLDISDVTSIEPASILLLCAQMSRIASERNSLRGNYPKDAMARAALIEAGFDEFLGLAAEAASSPAEPSLKLLRAKASPRLDQKKWLPLYEFMIHDGRIALDPAEALYNAFAECLENARQHAFTDRQGKHWFALAVSVKVDAG